MGFKDPNKNDVMYEWCSAGWLSCIKCVLTVHNAFMSSVRTSSVQDVKIILRIRWSLRFVLNEYYFTTELEILKQFYYQLHIKTLYYRSGNASEFLIY